MSHLHFQSWKREDEKNKKKKVEGYGTKEKVKRFNREKRSWWPQNMRAVFHMLPLRHSVMPNSWKRSELPNHKNMKSYSTKKKKKKDLRLKRPSPLSLNRVHHPHYIVTFPNHSRFTTAPADSWPPRRYELKNMTRWEHASTAGAVSFSKLLGDSPFSVLIINVIHEHQNIYAKGFHRILSKKSDEE